jgi:hypothetical protein
MVKGKAFKTLASRPHQNVGGFLEMSSENYKLYIFWTLSGSIATTRASITDGSCSQTAVLNNNFQHCAESIEAKTLEQNSQIVVEPGRLLKSGRLLGYLR